MARYTLIALCFAAGCSGDSGGGATDGGVPGDGSALPPGCTGVPIAQDGVLDVDLDVVRVTGTVTVEGAPLPAGAVGTIELVEKTTRVSYDLDLTRGATYAVLLTPGVYDVAFLGRADQCGVPPAPPLPCNGGVIRRDVALTSDGVLDLDIPVVEVSGAVTVNGAPLANDTQNRGAIGFVSAGQDHPVYAALGSTAAGRYAVTLLPGSYDVSFGGNGALCERATPPQAPCNSGVLRHSVSLTQDGVLDVDVPAVTVSGAVTVDGAPLADHPGRGDIAFAPPGSTDALAISLGTSGPGHYAARLLAGTYDVWFEGDGLECAAPPSPQVPCNAGIVKAHAAITADGVLDLDLRAVHVSGAVTVRGARLADESVNRGAIAFTAPGGTDGLRIALGETGAGSYAATLLAGSYDVRFEGNHALCEVPPAPQAPCNAGTIKDGVAITSDGVLDLDVPAVEVTGAVTVDGAPMPSLPSSRGALAFATPGGVLEVPLGGDGAAGYAVTLLPHSYDVLFDGNAALCASTTAPPVPCNAGPIKTGVALTSSGVLDLDLQTAVVHGDVTLSHQPLPAAAVDRGDVQFWLVGGGPASSETFAPSGAASYAMTLLRGAYVVTYRANPAICAPTPVGIGPPCSDQIVEGCD